MADVEQVSAAVSSAIAVTSAAAELSSVSNMNGKSVNDSVVAEGGVHGNDLGTSPAQEKSVASHPHDSEYDTASDLEGAEEYDDEDLDDSLTDDDDETETESEDDDDEDDEEEGRDGDLQGQDKADAEAQKKVDEDRSNPQYIPKRGTFYEHDDRTAEVDAGLIITEGPDQDDMQGSCTSGQGIAAAGAKSATTPTISAASKTMKKWQPASAVDRWSHDRFEASEQAPKSRTELVSAYGYDIRTEDAPPRARRRRRYGRGPSKYNRNWEDETAYLKINNKERKPPKASDFPELNDKSARPRRRLRSPSKRTREEKENRIERQRQRNNRSERASGNGGMSRSYYGDDNRDAEYRSGDKSDGGYRSGAAAGNRQRSSFNRQSGGGGGGGNSSGAVQGRQPAMEFKQKNRQTQQNSYSNTSGNTNNNLSARLEAQRQPQNQQTAYQQYNSGAKQNNKLQSSPVQHQQQNDMYNNNNNSGKKKQMEQGYQAIQNNVSGAAAAGNVQQQQQLTQVVAHQQSQQQQMGTGRHTNQNMQAPKQQLSTTNLSQRLQQVQNRNDPSHVGSVQMHSLATQNQQHMQMQHQQPNAAQVAANPNLMMPSVSSGSQPPQSGPMQQQNQAQEQRGPPKRYSSLRRSQHDGGQQHMEHQQQLQQMHMQQQQQQQQTQASQMLMPADQAIIQANIMQMYHQENLQAQMQAMQVSSQSPNVGKQPGYAAAGPQNPAAPGGYPGPNTSAAYYVAAQDPYTASNVPPQAAQAPYAGPQSATNYLAQSQGGAATGMPYGNPSANASAGVVPQQGPAGSQAPANFQNYNTVGGTTYFVPPQPQATTRPASLPQRRPTNAIPILPPSEKNKQASNAQQQKSNEAKEDSKPSGMAQQQQNNAAGTDNIDHIIDNMFVQRPAFQPPPATAATTPSTKSEIAAASLSTTAESNNTTSNVMTNSQDNAQSASAAEPQTATAAAGTPSTNAAEAKQQAATPSSSSSASTESNANNQLSAQE